MMQMQNLHMTLAILALQLEALLKRRDALRSKPPPRPMCSTISIRWRWPILLPCPQT